MHPKDQTRAVRLVVCPPANGPDLLRPGQNGLRDQLQRKPLGSVQLLKDTARMLGHLSQRLLAVKVLAAGDEPKFRGFKVFHMGVDLSSKKGSGPVRGFGLANADQLFHHPGRVGRAVETAESIMQLAVQAASNTPGAMFQAMPDLAPEPLGRIDVADLGHVVRLPLFSGSSASTRKQSITSINCFSVALRGLRGYNHT